MLTMTDGADNIPLKTMRVAIEPKQDLHGYDKPWIGGAGKNLGEISPATEGSGQFTTKAYANEGVKVSNPTAQYARQGYVFNVPNGTYTVSYYAKGNGYNRIYYGKNDGAWSSTATGWVGNVTVTDTRAKYTYTITTDTGSIFFGLYINTTPLDTSSYIEVDTFQIESGSTATDYEPYSNICPISGWDEATVTRTGKNLFNPDAKKDIWISIDGTIAATAGALTSQKIRCTKNDSFTISLSNGTGTLAIAFYNGSNELMGRNASGNVSTLTAIAPEGTEYLYAGRFRDSTANVQLELGSTATAYEPYISNTLTLPIQSISGSTVYGGTVTINEDGTGTLKVDRGITTLADKTFAAKQSSILPAGGYIIISGFKEYISAQKAVISDMLQGVVFDERGADGTISPLNSTVDAVNQLALFTKLSREEAIAAYGNATICYTLATPVTYTLTAIQIRTLLGNNVIYSDAGSVYVEYRADPSLSLTKKLEAISPTPPTVNGNYTLVVSVNNGVATYSWAKLS